MRCALKAPVENKGRGLLVVVFALISTLLAVYNLANGINVEETRHLVEQYKKENQTVIAKNRARQVLL